MTVTPAFALVLFDLDGTLVDSFGDIAAGIEDACAAIGVRATKSVLDLARRGVPLEDFFRAATGRALLDAELARFTEAYRAHSTLGCVKTTRPYPGVVATLEALRALPTPPRLGVATTKRTETAARVLEGTGLLPLIDALSGSDDLPHKPHPAVLRRTAERAGVPIEHALMVGDTDRDVGAARNAGIAVAGVTWGGFDAHEMRRLEPDWVIDRMEDLLDVVRGEDQVG